MTRFVFFGTPTIARQTLEALFTKGLLPSLIVTAPPRPQGRGMHLVETPVAVFAHEHNIPCITPEKITAEMITELTQNGPWDLFLVVAYGKILPEALLDSVQHKVLNLHPSLLPLYRGPSPLESVLLSDDTETGVSIMQLDKAVDHGPVIVQKKVALEQSMDIEQLTTLSAAIGSDLLADIIPSYIAGNATLTEQDHDSATHTRKYTKTDGLITDDMSDWQKWKVFRALGNRGWVHFETTKHDEPITVKITNASYDNETFVIEEVIPENGKRQTYADFLHSLN